MQPKETQPEVLFQRAVESYRSSDHSAVLAHCDRMLQLNPPAASLAAILNLKALGLAGLGNMIDAVAAIEQALAASPDEARLHLHAARLRLCLGRHFTALEHLREAARLAPSDPEPDFQAARVHQTINQAEAALEYAWSSVRKDERNFEGWMLLAELSAELGKDSDALQCLKPALDCEPMLPRAWAWLSEMEPRLKSGLPIGAKLRQARDQARNDEEYATAVFALAHRKRRSGRHAEAFALYQQANRRLDQARSFAMEEWEARVDDIIAASAPGRIPLTADVQGNPQPGSPGHSHGRAQNHSQHGPSKHPRLVFICGMPRSGTSLCEQIICSHPRVHGAGELPTMEYIEKCLRQRGIDPYGEDRSGWQEEMREVYGKSLPPIEESERLVIDKAPRNFERLGLVMRLFPEARVLWMLRHPLDTILSCYFQDFASNQEYSNRLEHAARVYRGHLRLLRHWRQQYGERLRVVEYAELVSGLETAVHGMAGFLGLDVQPAMLQPHLNPRIVRTSSASQVRQPIHTRSMDRWRNYADELAEVTAQLRNWSLIVAEGNVTWRL